MVDTDGRALELLVHRADVQDRDGAVPLLTQSRPHHPFVERAFAYSAYNCPSVADAISITIQIVRKFADQTGFVVHPRRWVIERTFAWINRNRRFAKDFERSIRSATAFLYAAAALGGVCIQGFRLLRSSDSRLSKETSLEQTDTDRRAMESD